MMPPARKPSLEPALLFGVLFGMAVACASWLLNADSSPYQLNSDFLRVTFGLLQIPATVLSMVITGNVHGGAEREVVYWIVVVVEWCCIGVGLRYLLAYWSRSR